MHKYGESKTTPIMMATVPHVTAWAGRTKYQADGFLFNWLYIVTHPKPEDNNIHALFYYMRKHYFIHHPRTVTERHRSLLTPGSHIVYLSPSYCVWHFLSLTNGIQIQFFISFQSWMCVVTAHTHWSEVTVVAANGITFLIARYISNYIMQLHIAHGLWADHVTAMKYNVKRHC